MKTKKIKSRQKKKSIRISPKIIIALIIAAVLFVFLRGPRGTIHLLESQREKEKLEKEVEELRLRKAALDSQKQRLENDPDYIEKVAREKYNMKKEGEKVYKITRDKE